ncbi:hypothetical protein FBU31_000713, partial [Coemansia sp. 'formosensis']
MNALLPFQLLPPHVVKPIVKHVVGSSRLRFAGVKPATVEYKKLLEPPLQVSDNFRAIAYSLYYNDYKIYIYVQSDKVDIEGCSWTRYIDSLDHSDCLISRKIQLRVHVCDIYEGKAFQLLTTEPYDYSAFRNARELTFDLVTKCSWDEDSEYTFEGADANILAFVQRIKKMAPRVCTIRLSITDMDGYLISRSGARMRFLLSNLSKLTTTTLFANRGSQLMECPDLALACKLTSIEVDIDKYASKILQLTRLTAETLLTIHIWSFYDVDVSGLIRDDHGDNNYVEYPCLRTLTMTFFHPHTRRQESPDIWQKSTFTGAVPFPSLRRLVLKAGYPFGDDVVFRGNGTTLEYLEVALYLEMVTVLKESGVFTHTSHPKLCSVNISAFA